MIGLILHKCLGYCSHNPVEQIKRCITKTILNMFAFYCLSYEMYMLSHAVDLGVEKKEMTSIF